LLNQLSNYNHPGNLMPTDEQTKAIQEGSKAIQAAVKTLQGIGGFLIRKRWEQFLKTVTPSTPRARLISRYRPGRRRAMPWL
jgi:hypothetical protein